MFHCKGILACLDGYMNIAMEQTEEYVNGQLKNKYGDAFIRGNNGRYWKEHLLWQSYHLDSTLDNNIKLQFVNAVLYISTSKRTLAEGSS